jgi:hypothetical protein
MQTLYSFTQFFNSICLSHPNIETFNVSDDMFDADTAKQTLFPLAYMVLNNATITGYSAMTYNVNLIVMDRVTDVTQDSSGKFNSITKNYKGITNLLDVWNTSMMTLSDIIVYIKNNAQPQDFTISTDVILTPFQERLDNALAGFSAVMNITVPFNPSACLFYNISDAQADGGINGCN